MKRSITTLALLLAASLQAETSTEIRAMVKKSLSGLNKEDEVKSGYVYRIYSERKEFDAEGKELSRSATLVQRELREGRLIGRLIERDGKPLPAAEMAQQEERIKKALAESEVPAQAPARRRGGDQAWIQEFPEALDYKVVGEEAIHGRAAIVLDFFPRAGYRPSNMKARIFEKMRGRMWIDKADSEMVKTDAEMFDTVSIGFGVLAKIAKGTQFSLGRRKTGEGHWLMEWTRFRFDARFLFKTIRQEQLTRFEDYRPRPDRARAATSARL